MAWHFDPQSGGNNIPVDLYDKFRTQVEVFSHGRGWFPRCRLSLKFKGKFCYLDVTAEGETSPSPLARLRYFRDNEWSLAFYTWSNERYSPCVFYDGKWQGSIEQAVETCESVLS